MSPASLPAWAQEMREVFRAETISQFVITGNIHDFVEHRRAGGTSFTDLKTHLAEVMFERFEVVLFYDRGRGIRVARGHETFFNFLKMFDSFHRSKFAADAGVHSAEGALGSPGLLPREPGPALELIDRFIAVTAAASREEGKGKPSLAVVLDYANFLIPAGESLYQSGEAGASLIRILGWASNPAVTDAPIATVLLTENLFDLNAQIVDNPTSAKIHIRLPSQEKITSYLEFLAGEEPSLAQASPLPLPALAEKMVGLSRLTIKGTVLRAIRNDQPLSPEFLARIKKETIEKEAGDRLVFLESRRTLDDVAGHHEAKSWLRQDATLLRRGATRALPMGYLVTGRIGTGKTYLVECFAGECGVPFVELKNFRDKWVGATEGNLEKIFAILHALGQVVVFVDEADQATGRRGGGEGDSGLSGRIYAMLAKEMADTRNRGRILWIFATSRPDLLEVDLKRPGRLDVHIPLFPPATLEDQQDLFLATARKLKIELARGEIPPLPFAGAVSGNEIEGVLVRALREFELQGAGEKGETLPALIARVLKEYRPSAHTRRLELMDLLAVQECTDGRFLPERFRGLTPEATLRRIRELSDPTQTEQPNDHE